MGGSGGGTVGGGVGPEAAACRPVLPGPLPCGPTRPTGPLEGEARRGKHRIHPHRVRRARRVSVVRIRRELHRDKRRPEGEPRLPRDILLLRDILRLGEGPRLLGNLRRDNQT